MMNAKAISARSRKGDGCARVFLFGFGAIFFLAGCGAFWGLFIYPLLKSWQAQRWPALPCRIMSSEVESHHDDDGTTYEPKIHYRYALDGKDFESERYTFTGMASSRAWAEQIVARFPAGTDGVCYYDPQNPSMAVLERGFSGRRFWLGLILPLVFIAVGAGVLIAGWKMKDGLRALGNRRGQTWASSQNPAPVENAAALASGVGSGDVAAERPSADGEFASQFAAFEGPRKLKQSVSRVAAAVGLGLIGLFWNGIVSVFLYAIISQGPRNGLTLLFIAPFVLVGLLLIVAFVHQFLSLANPSVEIALSSGAVAPGEMLDVAWQLTGRVHRLRQLTITIQGTERATYVRGTTTATDSHPFRLIEVLASDDSSEFAFGTRTVTIPADTIHSFKSPNNAIVWTIQVVGDIPWWPNINESFEFKVKPAKGSDENSA